ncbi:MAG TPA: malto-oligosyltrehalose trehalohydrolase [Planctomycetaceae bacterium]|jgi:maltooligosyltrehalose trehalohydrolase|nr:malto-oligosyltrehalose trehalohydrolase [Planctomycetaceae bacterium]
MDEVLLDSPSIDRAPTSCGALPGAGASIAWRVWAPRARQVDLLLADRGSGEAAFRKIAMEPEARGHFVYREEHIAEGQRYSFSIDSGPARPDPASRWQPDGLHRPSAVIRLDRFDWSEGRWKGLSRSELVIYELHVGTFTPEGTFDSLIGRLVELRDLGVTAIELMPVSQFPGGRSWGYDLAHPFAVQNTYGGPRGLQRLVAASHRVGLAVILDVIYNHFGPEGTYLGDFGPYFTDRYNTPWGRAINYDDAGSDEVRAFVLDNVRMWIRDFHVDGLRVDAVHAVYDFGTRHILREIKEVADAEALRLGRPVHVIAESDLNDARLLNPPKCGGYGLDAQWSDDFHHAAHAFLTGERTNYYADFGRPEQIVKAINHQFVYDGIYSPFRGRRHGGPAGDHSGDRFVVAIQNHDQIGNRPRGDRLGTILEPGQQRLAAGLLLLAPAIPLIFMGEEYDETRPFPYFCSFEDPQIADAARRGRRSEFAYQGNEDEVPDPQARETFESAKLSWSWKGSRQAGLRNLYQTLLAMRRRWFPLSKSLGHRASLVKGGSDGALLLRLDRTISTEEGDSQLVAVFNIESRPQRLPKSEQIDGCLLLLSEDSQFGGARSDNDGQEMLLPFEFWVFGPNRWSER